MLIAGVSLSACILHAGTTEVWESGGGFRFVKLPVPATGSAGFTLLDSRATGITFSNLLSDATVARNRLLEIGSGVALGDVDGRVDLVVVQHGGPGKLFRNVRGTPGVRVALQSSKRNPDAIGAVVRLRFGERVGPARATHAGSGYWSQDSPVLVLAAPAEPDALQVNWPGGRRQEWPWPGRARSVEVTPEGIKPK